MHEHIDDIILKKKDSDGDVFGGGVDCLSRPRFEPQHHIKLNMVRCACNHRRHGVGVGRLEVEDHP